MLLLDVDVVEVKAPLLLTSSQDVHLWSLRGVVEHRCCHFTANLDVMRMSLSPLLTSIPFAFLLSCPPVATVMM